MEDTMRQFARHEIHARLRATMDRGEPLIIGGAGIGLVAKAAERR
jgi:predicted TIM-barrel enzyme